MRLKTRAYGMYTMMCCNIACKHFTTVKDYRVQYCFVPNISFFEFTICYLSMNVVGEIDCHILVPSLMHTIVLYQ